MASGSLDPDVYFLGISPSQIDYEKGSPFMDEEGFFIRNMIKKFFESIYYPEEWTSFSQQDMKITGKPFASKVRFNNCLRCDKDGNPTEHEINCCKKFLEDDVEKTKPKIIIGFGEIPLKTVVKVNGIGDWRGRKVPVKIGSHTCWYFPIQDVAPILDRKKKSKFPSFKDDWEKLLEFDFKRIAEFLRYLPAFPPVLEDPSAFEKNITINFGKTKADLDQVRLKLEHFKKFPDLALDIETNSKLRPYCADGRIITMAIGTYDEVYAFPIEHPDCWNGDYTEILALVKDFLLNSGVKICHNVKFELEWLLWKFGKDVLFKTKWGCTMAQAFHIDERVSKTSESMLSLNRLCLLYFGFKLKDQSTVDTKNILRSTLQDILIYNGMDVKYTYGIYKIQGDTIDKSLYPIYDHSIDTSRTLAITQNSGIPVNHEKVASISFKLKTEIDKISNEISLLPEVKQFEKNRGAFNFDSSEHLVTVFRDILKLESVKSTKKKVDGFSTDKEVLDIFAAQGIKIAKLVKDYRELNKLKSTYVDSLPALSSFDKKLHSNFHNLFVSTGRLSSADPNMQNFPKRKNSYVREVIYAPSGYVLLSADYGQIEARCIAMASRDKVFTKMIWDNYDVHMDWALKAVKRNPSYGKASSVSEFENDKKLAKSYRSLIKNKLVFPWFYGASKYSVARDLGFSDEDRDYLFDLYWQIFEGVKKWQENLVSFYDRYGYVTTLTGRRRHAPLTKNELLNAPIQGTSSDIVVNAMNRLGRIAYETDQPHLHPVLNIHDDLTFLIPVKSLEQDIDIIAREMCTVPYDFVNVPISIEMSVGKDWFKMEELETFDSRQFEKS